MKKLSIAITLLATMVSCEYGRIYEYEALDNKGRKIKIYYNDYKSMYIDNPFKLGQKVYYAYGNEIRDCEQCYYDTATITKIK